MNLERLLDYDDRVRIQEAIRTVELPLEVDYWSVVRRVLRAAERFLDKDLTASQMLIEQPWDTGTGKGIFDLVLIWPDRCWILDWKCPKDSGSPLYSERVLNSLQTALYLVEGSRWLKANHGVEPSYLEYRVFADDGAEKQFGRHRGGAEMEAFCKSQLASVAMLYCSYFDGTPLPTPAWPMHMPSACFKGAKSGPTCPFWQDCTKMTMPDIQTLPGKPLYYFDHVPRSKSSVEDFLECPERFRRTRLCGDTTPPTVEQSIGAAFHLGIAELYRVAWERKCNQAA